MRQHTRLIIGISILTFLALLFTLTALFIFTPLFAAPGSRNTTTNNQAGKSISLPMKKTPSITKPKTTGTTMTTSSNSTGNQTTSVTPSPEVHSGPQACPAAVNNPSYWNSILHPVFGSKVYTVSCANLLGNPSLQALVTTICDCSGGFMNVYVYTDITSAPRQLFKLESLGGGVAKISNYNTVLTGQIDEQSSINKNATADASLVTDLYREFKWSNSANVFQQVSFPGIFPDLTRYQAENDQAQVDQGHQPWKISAVMTAQAFAASLLKWNPDSPATLLNGGGPSDVSAVVEVRNSAPANQIPITITMNRLEGNTNHGIWIVIAAASQYEVLTQPHQGQVLTSPASIQGNTVGTNGTAGTIVVLDHLYTNIGQAVVPATNGYGRQLINTTVNYNSSFGNSRQQEEGVVMLYDTVNSNGSIAHATFVKVLLGGSQ